MKYAIAVLGLIAWALTHGATSTIEDGDFKRTYESMPLTAGLPPRPESNLPPRPESNLPPRPEPKPNATSTEITITVSADNAEKVYVDGQLLGSSDTWEQAGTYRTTLRGPEHVIAIDARDTGGVAAMIAHITWAAGQAVRGGFWLMTTTDPGEGWEQLDFDDSSWNRALTHGGYGVESWHKRVSGLPRETEARWIWARDVEKVDRVWFRYHLDLSNPLAGPVPNPATNPEPRPQPQPKAQPKPQPKAQPKPQPKPRPGPPPVPSDLADAPIGQLAAGLGFGEWALLDNPPIGLSGYRPDGTGAPSVDEWTSSAYWDPVTQCSYFFGLRISNRFVKYCAQSDEWSIINFVGDENAPDEFERTGHQYERSALDKVRGHFYVMRGQSIYRYVIADDRWEKYSDLGFGNQVIEWHDSLDMLVNLNNNVVRGWNGGDVVVLGQSPVDGYHSSARYNPVRDELMMIGGNQSLNTVAIMKSDGSVVKKADAPFAFSINVDDLTYDPLTGNYIVSNEENGRSLWEYDPDRDEWKEIGRWSGHSTYPLHWYMRNVPIVIDELGVIAWQIPTGLMLYRHQTLFESTQAEAVPDPDSPVEPEPTPEPAPVPEEPPIEPGPVDTDGDGVADASDECPDVAGPTTVGCPAGWTSDGALLAEEAATMEPGEWRQLFSETDWPRKDPNKPGNSFKGIQYVSNGITGADGMGWTQDLVLHEGRLLLWLNRSGIARALLGMNSDGSWWRVNDPDGGFGSDRRPFNKLMYDDEYLYFAPNGCKTCMGVMIRTPLDDPGVFETYGVAIGDDQMDSVGSFAMEYVPEWGRFYAYTPGGKIWTWAHGEEVWTRLGMMPVDAEGLRGSGYAGLVHWNPIKQELLFVGGQSFGRNPQVGHKIARITAPMQIEIEALPDLHKADGTRLSYISSQPKLIVDPRDGGYLFIDYDKLIYRSDNASGPYQLYDNIGGGGEGAAKYALGNYELYAPFHALPGTDVIVFVSHLRGVVLHRLKP